MRLTTGHKLFTAGLAGGLCMALALALLIGGLSGLVNKDKTAYILGLVSASLLTVWFIFCCLTFDAYKVYMPPDMILSQAGNAARDFGGNVIRSVINSIPLILLYFVPVLVALLLPVTVGRRANIHHPAHLSERPKRIKPPVFLLSGAVLIFVVGRFLCVCTEDLRYQYGAGYTYDSAMNNFGAVAAFTRELSGNGAMEDSFYIAAEDSFSTWTESEAHTEREEESISAAAPEVPKQAEPVAIPEPEAETEAVERQTAEEEAPRQYGYNSMDIDFAALTSSNTKIAALNSYIHSIEPSRQNEYTGMFENKNLILITAEAFSKEVIDPERTPTLYRMATKGIVFEDFYQPSWGGSTSTGEYSFLTGLAPMEAMVMMASRNSNMYLTMGNQLNRLGYNSFAYHNGTYSYYSRNLTLPNMGYDSYMGIGNGMEKGLTGGLFPESDQEMMDFTVPLYIDSQPFSVYYMTISGHASYGFKDSLNDMCVKHQAVTENLPYSEPVQAYLACNMELEYAMESLICQLEEVGIADDTVIALVSDHYPYGLLPSNAFGGQKGLLDELYGFPADSCRNRDHNAAIIWCAELEKSEPIVVSKPVCSIDILPTLSNLFGLEYDSRLMAGQDALSDEEGLVLWNDGCWLSEKGYYDTHKRSFIPNEGVQADESYVERVQKLVSDRLSLSRIIETSDYYGYLFPEK